MQNFHMPPTGYGPGSQTEEGGEELEYMSMPQDMRTYSARLPDIDAAPAPAEIRRSGSSPDPSGARQV